MLSFKLQSGIQQSNIQQTQATSQSQLLSVRVMTQSHKMGVAVTFQSFASYQNGQRTLSTCQGTSWQVKPLIVMGSIFPLRNSPLVYIFTGILCEYVFGI